MVREFGTEKHVFIDWDLVEPGYGLAWGGDGPASFEMPYGVRLAVHPPRIDWQPLVEIDKPWEHDIEVHHSIIEDDGRFRLYYRIWDIWGRGGGHAESFRLAYAESEDGVNWVKPNVGTFEFEGSTDNNILDLGRPAGSPVVFKDPSAGPDERYKLVFRGTVDGKHEIWGATSADGLHWDVLDEPLLKGYHSDTHNIVAYSEAKGKYVGYFRGWDPSASVVGRRTIAYAETDDFTTWPQPQTIVGPDVQDSPDTDFYTNSYTPWPGANAHLIFPAVFERRLDVTELHMFTSRDGLKWQRISREPVIPVGPPGSGMEAGVYAGVGLVSIRPGEWSIPIAPQATTHNQCQFEEGIEHMPHHGFVCLATWREDGFTSIEAESEGSFSTSPFTFDGRELEINSWSNYGGAIQVEVAEAPVITKAGLEAVADRDRIATVGRGDAPPVEGLTFADCDVITGDNLRRTVTWKGESDLSSLAGKSVRLRFKMHRSRLHSMKFT